MSRHGGPYLLCRAATNLRSSRVSCSRTGVGVAIHVQQARRVHRRINLGRGQARVAEQLLQRPKIRPSRQKVSRKAVPRCGMRRQRVGEPKAAPRRRDCSPHQVGVQRPAARPDK